MLSLLVASLDILTIASSYDGGGKSSLSLWLPISCSYDGGKVSSLTVRIGKEYC